MISNKVESVDRDIDKIITYCEKISSRQQDNPIFKSWLENIIYKFGMNIFEGNIPNLTQQKNGKNNELYIISKALSDEIDKLNNFNLGFIKNISQEKMSFIFLKFLYILSQKYPKLDFVFLSASNFLYKDEFVLNVYNVRDVQSYADFIQIKAISKNSIMKFLNIDDNGIFTNNLSFINSTASALLEDNKIASIVFDFHFNLEITKEQLMSIITLFNKIKSDYN